MSTFRTSLPLRMAAITTALLALLLIGTAAAFYVMTALEVRRGVDAAMLAAVPVSAEAGEDVRSHARRLEEDEWEERHAQVIEAGGRVVIVDRGLPVDPGAVAEVRRTGAAFRSLLVTDNDHEDRGAGRNARARPTAAARDLQPRTGPEWWQALTPAEGELRVLYAQVRDESEDVILQVAAPIGSISESLPDLLVRILALAAAATVLCGLIVWRMAGEFYRPLRTVTAAADEIAAAADITPQTLSRRIPDCWHDATLQRLIGVFNAMMARLQAAFDAQSRFAAAAAHELRGPLGAMRAELEVTLRRERSPADYRQALQGALAEAERLSDLAQGLLELARMQAEAAGHMEPGWALAPVLARAAAEVQHTGGDVHVQVVPPDLDLDGDPLTLERAIVNLARNGLQAGSQAVWISAGAEGEGVAISVRDAGQGIATDHLPHVFAPFYRADAARRRDGGTGLGLALVKAAVDMHRGRIALTSQPGQGTTVQIWLPRRQPGIGGGH